MLNHKLKIINIEHKTKKSKNKFWYPTRRDNLTFFKSNYKYKRRFEMRKLRNQNRKQKNQFNKFTKTKATTTTTKKTFIAATTTTIIKECNSINVFISGSNGNAADAAIAYSSRDKWRKHTHNKSNINSNKTNNNNNTYAMILRMLLLITNNFKLRIQHKMMHHNVECKIKPTITTTFNKKCRLAISNNIKGVDEDDGVVCDGGLAHNNSNNNNDVNIAKNDEMPDYVKVVATSTSSSSRSTPVFSFHTSTMSSTPSFSYPSKPPVFVTSFVCSTTASASLSATSSSSLSATSRSSALSSSTSTRKTLSTQHLPFSTLCNAARFNDKLFTYLSALFITFALCARGVAGGACWQSALSNGKCNQLYSMNITRAECCGRNPDFSFTERNPSDVEYFFATAIGGGMECSPCIESCKNVECAANKKCVKRKGRPKCICAPECGKASRRQRAQQQQHQHHSIKHYRGHLHHSEQMPRSSDILSLSSEKITNFNLGIKANGGGVGEGGDSGGGLENHQHYERNQRTKQIKQHNLESQHYEEEKLSIATGHGSTATATENETRQHQHPHQKQQSTKSMLKNCKNQTHNHVSNNRNNINCKSSQQQQQVEIQSKSFLRERQERNQINKRKQQRPQQHNSQKKHHNHYQQHHYRHHSNSQMQREHKFKDQRHQQQTTMTKLTLPINGASTTFLPTSLSSSSIYNTKTATAKSKPLLTEEQQTSSSSLSSSSSTTPLNSTKASLPSIFVVAADRHRHHLLNRGSIFTTSSLATTASQPWKQQPQQQHHQQQQQLIPSSEFFSAISKVPLSSSVVEIPDVTIVGVGSSITSPPSSSALSTTKAYANADLTLFNKPGLVNEGNENVYIDVAPHSAHPICGTDGRTYNSECQLKKRACRTNNSQLKVAYRGHCKTSCNGVKCLNGLMCVEDQYMTPHCIPCKIQCPQDDDDEPIVNDYERNLNKKTSSTSQQQQKSYIRHTTVGGIDPTRAVCGVDGKTYKSTCDINRMICKIGRAIAVAYPGPCQVDRITCSDINCGSKHKCLVDLLTHEPRCVSCSYKCSRKHFAASLRYESGKICGVNNRTYNSWCEMRKDSCTTGFFIDVKAAGKCK